MQQALPPDPMMYSTAPPLHLQGQYGSGLNPQASAFAMPHTSPMYYPGQPAAGLAPEHQQHQQHMGALGYQPPYPYADPHQYPQQPGLPPQPMLPQHGVPQPGLSPYGQQPMLNPGTSPYAAAQQPQPLQPHHPLHAQQPPMPGQPQMGQPSPYQGQPPQVMGQPYGVNPYGQPLPGAGAAAPQPGGVQPGGLAADPAVHAVGPATGSVPSADVAPAAPNPAAAAGQDPQAGGDQPQVLLHITTHDWEPDQSGQLRVRKGTLVNVSHRAAHGWVYAATVQPGGDTNEPVAEGWVPQAVAKRVSLCRVVVDWPAEGSGTLGLLKGDLIAVSKEAERGWVYGERISPRREGFPADGWLPKKVLEYILI